MAKRPHSQCRRSKLDHHTLPLKFPYVAAKTQHSQINKYFFLKNRPEPCQCKVEAVVTAAQGQLCFSDLFPWVILLPWHSFASKGPDRCFWNVYVYVHLHTYLCIRVYTYLHTCVYTYTCIYVYFCVYMPRDSHRVCPCNPSGAWCQDTQIPNFVNAQVPYKQVPASPVSTSSVSLSAGSACHCLEIDTQSFKRVTKQDYKGKENTNALYFCKTFYLYQKLLHLLLSCFIPNLWGTLPACVFSHVGLFVAPWTVAHQAPLSMGFSRQEYWSGLPCPPPGDLPNPGLRTSVSCTSCISSLPTEPPGKPLRYIGGDLVAQLCPTLCDPMDCSLPGSSVHGIFQASILEWVAIAFSTEIDWADVIRSPISQIRRLNFKYCVLLWVITRIQVEWHPCHPAPNSSRLVTVQLNMVQFGIQMFHFFKCSMLL